MTHHMAGRRRQSWNICAPVRCYGNPTSAVDIRQVGLLTLWNAVAPRNACWSRSSREIRLLILYRAVTANSPSIHGADPAAGAGGRELLAGSQYPGVGGSGSSSVSAATPMLSRPVATMIVTVPGSTVALVRDILMGGARTARSAGGGQHGEPVIHLKVERSARDQHLDPSARASQQGTNRLPPADCDRP